MKKGTSFLSLIGRFGKKSTSLRRLEKTKLRRPPLSTTKKVPSGIGAAKKALSALGNAELHIHKIGEPHTTIKFSNLRKGVTVFTKNPDLIPLLTMWNSPKIVEMRNFVAAEIERVGGEFEKQQVQRLVPFDWMGGTHPASWWNGEYQYTILAPHIAKVAEAAARRNVSQDSMRRIIAECKGDINKIYNRIAEKYYPEIIQHIKRGQTRRVEAISRGQYDLRENLRKTVPKEMRRLGWDRELDSFTAEFGRSYLSEVISTAVAKNIPAEELIELIAKNHGKLWRTLKELEQMNGHGW